MKPLQITLGFKSIPEKSFPIEEMNYEAYFVSSLFSEYLDGQNLPKLDRITIELVNSKSDEAILPPTKHVNVCHIKNYADINKYLRLDQKKERYEFLLERLVEILTDVSNKLSWSPASSFEDAKISVIRSEFSKQNTIVNTRKSSNKEQVASIIVDLGERENVISLSIGDDKLIPLFRMTILESDFSFIAQKLRWITDSELEIMNKHGELIYNYDLLNKKLTMSIIPKDSSKEYIEDELKLFDSRTSKEEYDRICKKRLDVFI